MQPLVLVLLGDDLFQAAGSLYGLEDFVSHLLKPRFRKLSTITTTRTVFITTIESPVTSFTRLGKEPALKKELQAIFEPRGIDFFLLSESAYFSRKKLVAFDLDSTLIQAEGIDEFAREMGVYEKVATITERAMKGEIDFVRSFEDRVACLQGLTVSQIEKVRARVELSPGSVELLEGIREFGAKSIILSGGFDRLAELVRAKAHVEWIHTNHLEVVGGVCTGKFIPPIIDGAKKAELLLKTMEVKGFLSEEVIAIGDGSNDIPMFGVAGISVSYRGKKAANDAADGVLLTSPLSRLLALLS